MCWEEWGGDDGSIVSPSPHAVRLRDSRATYLAVERRRRGTGDICGVLPTSFKVGDVSSGWVTGEVTQPGKNQRAFYVPELEGKITILQEVPMPLPWCEHCGMHMPVSQLWRHNWMSIFYRSMEMSLKRRYLEMAERLGEMEFRFYER